MITEADSDAQAETAHQDGDPAEEPHWVSWAEGTEDEMCYSTVATRVSDG